MLGRGSGNLLAGETSPSVHATYEDGAWTAVFTMPRDERFAEDTFIPIAFSVWDGFNDERVIAGVSRGGIISTSSPPSVRRP